MAITVGFGRFTLAVILAAVRLALSAEQQAAVKIGLLRARAASRQTPLLSPSPNDTISVGYWNKVDTAIAIAGATTSRQPTLNDPAATPTPLPWQKVLGASQPVTVVDTNSVVSSLQNWQTATPLPPAASAAQNFWMSNHAATAPVQRHISVVPYDMAVGADIMYGLSVKNTPTPPPTQDYVNEVFVAQCPMVMFSNSIHVRAPRCGNTLGEWVDPNTNRIVMRWQENGGGIRLGIDSVVSGNGSVTFATMDESFSVNSYFFELRNCLNVMRYKIEEQIIKVNHMSRLGHSTAVPHDQAGGQSGIFYRYIIRHPNGTTAADTGSFRMGQDSLNITAPPTSNQVLGLQIATASRVGTWKRNQWRDCRGTPRGWALSFPANPHLLDTVATVQDLRVAATAVINLMAWRDESASADGFQHTGTSGSVYKQIFKSAVLIFFVFILVTIVYIMIAKKGVDKKLSKFLFKLEGVILPKRPVKVRQPVLTPSY